MRNIEIAVYCVIVIVTLLFVYQKTNKGDVAKTLSYVPLNIILASLTSAILMHLYYKNSIIRINLKDLILTGLSTIIWFSVTFTFKRPVKKTLFTLFYMPVLAVANIVFTVMILIVIYIIQNNLHLHSV